MEAPTSSAAAESDMVRNIVNILTSQPSLQSLKPYIHHLTPSLIPSIFSSASHSSCPSTLLTFFQWCQTNVSNFTHDCNSLPSLLILLPCLFKQNKFSAAKSLLLSFIAADTRHVLHYHLLHPSSRFPFPSKALLDTAVGAYIQYGKPHLAFQIFKKMKRHRLLPTVLTCNTLLNSLGEEIVYFAGRRSLDYCTLYRCGLHYQREKGKNLQQLVIRPNRSLSRVRTRVAHRDTCRPPDREYKDSITLYHVACMKRIFPTKGWTYSSGTRKGRKVDPRRTGRRQEKTLDPGNHIKGPERKEEGTHQYPHHYSLTKTVRPIPNLSVGGLTPDQAPGLCRLCLCRINSYGFFGSNSWEAKVAAVLDGLRLAISLGDTESGYLWRLLVSFGFFIFYLLVEWIEFKTTEKMGRAPYDGNG